MRSRETINKNLGNSALLGYILELSTASGNSEEWLQAVEPKLLALKARR